MYFSSSSVALQPGVGLSLLYNTPPSLSIPCSVSPFIYSHLSQVCGHIIQPSHFWSSSSSCCIQLFPVLARPYRWVRKLLLKMSCSHSYVLAHRLQTLRERSTFQDSSRSNLQISIATHKMMYVTFCSCCRLFHMFPKQQQCCSLLITFLLQLDKRHRCLFL